MEIINTLKSVFVDKLFKLGVVGSRRKVLEATTTMDKPENRNSEYFLVIFKKIRRYLTTKRIYFQFHIVSYL